MTKTMTASEALSIVAKDETKVAKPKIVSLRFASNYIVNDEGTLIIKFFAKSGQTQDTDTWNFAPSYFLPSVEWEVFNRADLLQGKE